MSKSDLDYESGRRYPNSSNRSIWRRQRLLLTTLLLFVGGVFFYTHDGLAALPSRRKGNSSYANQEFGEEPANSTLGFGAVLAVSKPDSSRRPGLIFAGNITNIDITIPAQPTWTDAQIAGMMTDDASSLSHGSALAWLGHMNAVQWFLDSGLETAIILEDDVDWDIHLRTVQIPKLARAMRDITNDQHNYYGDPSQWDILYWGHCGDMFRPERFNPKNVTHAVFPDPTAPGPNDLHLYTKIFFQRIGLPPHMRMVHRSIFPLCTFAYAINKDSARRLLLDSVAGKEQPGGTPAYDVRMLELCRDLDWKCFSVQPELFHHMEAPSEISAVDGRDADTLYGLPDRSQQKLKGWVGPFGSPNIKCGARSRNFYTTDPAALEYLQEVVGRQGECLYDQLEDDAERWP